MATTSDSPGSADPFRPVILCLEKTLETSCAALVGLEAAKAQGHLVVDELLAVRRQVLRSIDSARSAISGLRTLSERQASVFAFGFVSDAQPRFGTGGQSRPRRTA